MSDAEQGVEDGSSVIGGDEDVEFNLLDEPTRIAGLVLMSISLALAVYLAAWTFLRRNSPVVKAMQPAFLCMLTCGSMLSLLAIVPMGMNDFNTANIDAACMSIHWLEDMGESIQYIALVAKLWRVNQIFKAAESMRRKTVTVKDVLWPFSIVLLVNLSTLIVQTAVDPVVWKRYPIEDDWRNTFGVCMSESAVGISMESLRGMANFIALIILCVQAYKARGIESDFSEARGVVLTGFVMLEATILGLPAYIMMEDGNAKAKYIVGVLGIFSVNTFMLLFIFGPIMAKERKRLRGAKSSDDNAKKVHVSGLAQGLHDSSTSTSTNVTEMVYNSVVFSATKNASESGDDVDGDSSSVPLDLNAALLRIVSLESQLQEMRSRIPNLEEP